MNMVPQEAVFGIVIVMALTFHVVSPMEPDYASDYNCSQTCGSGSSAKHVRYPFGFSPGCKIQLNCTDNSQIMIGEYKVVNLTSSSIFVQFPAACNRSISAVQPLFGHYYAPNWTNGFLFQECKSPLSGCLLSSSFANDRFKSCKGGNISCFSVDKKNSHVLDVINYKDLNSSGCEYLFSSIAAVEPDRNSLQLQALDLGWWVDGSCEVCSLNATCSAVLVSSDVFGFRCSCSDGFTGSGFVRGGGCQEVTNCRGLDYFSRSCGHVIRVVIPIGATGAFLMAALSVICYIAYRRAVTSKTRSARHLLSEVAGNLSITLYQYKEIERATDGFSERLRLGTGAYGTVYFGRFPNNELVAIKRIKHTESDSIDKVMNEIKLLSNIGHPNLVRLLGCCIEDGEQILVYEYMPNGTLSQHLQRERGGKGIPWTIRLNIAAETANAISYLHFAVNPPIYHRDIKSSNILLDFRYKAKIADFGLSRFGATEINDHSHISTAPQGTPGYVDPQYHQNFHLSDKSDVYSFGVVLMEIISGLKVIDLSRPHSEVNLAALAIDRIGRGCVDELIDPFLEPNRDAWTLSSIHKVIELAFRCLAFQKDVRPSMKEVAEELELIRLSGWAPVEENTLVTSSVASSCSSVRNGSEMIGFSTKKADVSKKLLVSQREGNHEKSTADSKERSPASEQSSLSTTSLLSNVVQ